MHKTQSSSDFLSRRRYCLTTGQVGCCSGEPGPAGATGPAGKSLCYGPVYSGVVTTEATAPSVIGATGTYGLQMPGTVLYQSDGSVWGSPAEVPPSSYYFMNTGGTRNMYHIVDDTDFQPTEVTNCDIILATNTGIIHTRSSGGWESTISLMGQSAPDPASAYGVTGSFTINGSTVDSELLNGTISTAFSPSSIHVSSTVILSPTPANISEGVLYIGLGTTIKGMEFPYTTSTTRPVTVTISQVFSNVESDPELDVYLYAIATNSIGVTGASGTLSIMYNMP